MYMPMLRTVGESPEFTRQLVEFGGARLTDKLIDRVKDNISKLHYHFPELIPNSGIRHVKTNEFFSDGIIIPALKIWFTILDENRVLMIGISRVVDDEFDEFIF